MLCEMCGKQVTFCKKVTIEGVQLEVCSECARFGKEQKQAAPAKPAAPKPIIAQRLEVRERRGKPKDILEGIDREELVDDYSKRVRDARSSKGMSQKELAAKLNEKLNLIAKVELGDIRPDEKLIAKLQKELGIVLKEQVATVLAAKESKGRTLTLADLIRIEKK
jgi:putative transcription factor